MAMKKSYSSREAAGKIGISLRQLARWLAAKLIRPSIAVPMSGGRTLWRWTAEDVEKARRVKTVQRPGPKPRRGAK